MTWFERYGVTMRMKFSDAWKVGRDQPGHHSTDEQRVLYLVSSGHGWRYSHLFLAMLHVNIAALCEVIRR
jgi:hypothetical protein